MNSARRILGLVAGVAILLGVPAHAILGWKSIAGQLAAIPTPPDLVTGLGIVWQSVSIFMFAFACIVIFLFVRVRRSPTISLIPAFIIGLAYVVLGVWAFFVSRSPFFLMFFFIGLALLIASWPFTQASPRT